MCRPLACFSVLLLLLLQGSAAPETVTLKVSSYITSIHAVESGIASVVRRHPEPFGNRSGWGSTCNLISIGKCVTTIV